MLFFCFTKGKVLKKNHWQLILVFLATVVVMFLMNYWMPLHRDDYDYALIWGTVQHIDSWADVGESLYRHYISHGGRMVSFFFLDVFLWQGKFWFNFCNAGIFTGLVLLIYLNARRDFQGHWEASVLGATSMLAWLSFPHFGEVAVWMCGSVVYLWTGFLATLFLLPYNLYHAGNWHWHQAYWTPLMFGLGVLAGWSVENLAVSVLVITSFFVWQAKMQLVLKSWLVAGWCGAMLGAIGLIAAPGNFVRYDDQGTGKNFVDHIGNQFAGNGEMLLYILPAILLLFLCWYILHLELYRRQGNMVPEVEQFTYTNIAFVVLGMLVLVWSYFQGGVISGAMRVFIQHNALEPLGLMQANTEELFINLMSGFEEMAIFWLSMIFVYLLARRALHITARNVSILRNNVKCGELWRSFPEVRYGVCCLWLAFFNNLVMLAAPTFPARATFSSVIMFLIGTVAIARMSVVKRYLRRSGAVYILRLGGLGVTAFTIVAALTIMHTMYMENQWRLSLVQQELLEGDRAIEMPPISWRNRALRHVYFEDFNNNVTKDGLIKFYGLDRISVTK